MRPRILDLFCGAGGAGFGYSLAGFDVVGVDVIDQPNYPFTFHKYDAVKVLEEWTNPSDYAAVHASPPCPGYANVTKWRGSQEDHPRLIGPVRDLLDAISIPYVIENVVTNELRSDFMLCGSMFGLPIRRHRYFETNWSGLHMAQPCQHKDTDYSFDHGSKQPESVYRDAMECEWMTVKESRDAIPPAFTRFIGERLIEHLAGELEEAA